jgi:hypothetical protein
MAVATTLKTTTPDLLAIYFQSPHRACGTVWSETPPPFI